MKQQRFVLFKDPRTSSVEAFDPDRYVLSGETVTSVQAQVPYPVTTPMLAVTMNGVNEIQLDGGADNHQYGCNLLLTMSSGRQVIVLLVVACQEPSLIPQEYDPTSYLSLVREIQAGNAAVGTATFVFPPNVDPTGGHVVWCLLDSEGQVHNEGNAFDFKVVSNGAANIVRAQCLINVPSDLQPSGFDEKYQIRYTLYNADNVAASVMAESVTVIGLNTVPLGAQDVVEYQGTATPVILVTDSLYKECSVSIHRDNVQVGHEMKVTEFERVSDGYMWKAMLFTDQLPVSIEPMVIVWSYVDQNGIKYRENAKLFIVNSSITDAIADVLARINKARTTLYGTPDMLFPESTVMLWLRRAMDYFNGFGGIMTNITMTNAKGIFREYWLQIAEMFALESQELAEAEKAFNYSGADISLDVDRTQGYAAAADKIRQRIDTDLRPVKINIINKGNGNGDGSADPSQLRPGALAAVGVQLTPASLWSQYPNSIPRTR